MKIAIVTPVFPPYRGGIGAVAKEQAEAFSNEGHEVTVFSPDYATKKSDQDNLKYRLCLLRPIIKYGNAAFIPQLIWNLRGFDRVILHYPFFGAAELFLLIGLKSKPVIFYHMDVAGRGVLGAFFRWHQKYIMPLILGRASKVIVTSGDYARSGALGRLVAKHPEKFIEIPLGVDTGRFAPRERDSELTAKLKIVATDKVILFVGGLDSAHYFKGVDVLLHAFQKFLVSCHLSLVTCSKLVIVGDGNLRSSYANMAKESGISEQVIFAGSATAEDLPKYYNLADLFVLPSVDSSEAFGLVILEAMASGVPVIASNLPGVRTLVDVGRTGYLADLGDSEDLARKIRAYFSDLEKARLMGKEARNAAEEYSIKSVRERWNKII